MVHINDAAFEKIVTQAIDNIPKKYAKHISNLAFVIEEEPTPDQQKRLRLNKGQTLFGLYEGIPLTKRDSGYNMVLPDKITVFKHPIESSSNTLEELKANIRKTIWHEVAHYFGLDHDQINNLETRS